MAKLQINFPAAPAKPIARTWSTLQTAIFANLQSTNDSLIIEAVAGSGKTTTIVEAIKRVSGSTIFLAFNKSIATELQSRGVPARTFHSLTYTPVTRFFQTRDIEPNKLSSIVNNIWSEQDASTYGYFAKRLCSLARQIGVPVLQPDEFNTWHNLAEHHDLELERGEYETAIKLSQSLLKQSNDACKSGSLDFDDLLYQPILNASIPLPKFNNIFVDEAQDTNAIQRALLRRISNPNSRIVAVGDPHQAIYGFRGADSDSLDLIATEFKCKRLPLSITYRCPLSVVTEAQLYVKHIQAAPQAKPGSVTDLGVSWTPQIFQANDLVVCRTTSPLIALGYRMLQARIPVQIAGRDIGEGLKTLIRKLSARGIDSLATKLQVWAERETKKATKSKNESKAQSIQDKAASILCLIDSLPETDRTIPALLRILDDLFAPGIGKTLLSTIHRVKGLEAPRVYWLNPGTTLRCSQAWQQQQESNLAYVAITRAQDQLIKISEPLRK